MLERLLGCVEEEDSIRVFACASFPFALSQVDWPDDDGATHVFTFKSSFVFVYVLDEVYVSRDTAPLGSSYKTD